MNDFGFRDLVTQCVEAVPPVRSTLQDSPQGLN